MKVQDLSIEELKAFVGAVVEEKLQEMFCDPDWELELKDEVKQRLKRSLEETRQGRRGIPLEDVAVKLGI